MYLTQIKADLPNMPDEIIEVWLEPHAKRESVGWPPTHDNYWKFILGFERDLRYLQSLECSKLNLELTPNLLTQESFRTIVGFIKTHVFNEPNEFTDIPDGKDRFLSCCTYLKECGVFPKPIILEKLESGLHVLDGHHRLSAFFYLYGFFNIQNEDVPCLKVETSQTVWMAQRN